MKLTTRQVDAAIKAGITLTVRNAFGELFTINITSRDHRMVSGTYTCKGVAYNGTFERRQLTLVK